MWSIGHDTEIETAMILDSEGGVDVNIDFIRAHPSWYSYYGTCRVNGNIVHTFVPVLF